MTHSLSTLLRPRLKKQLGVLLVSATLLTAPLLSFAEPDAKTQSEITQLLQFIGHSDCSFIRNNKNHDADEAVEHIQKKYEHFYEDIDTAEKFIEVSATGSLISRKPYYIDCPGQERQTSSAWLNSQLAEIRAKSKSDS
ncbi:DUF5329 family protein [Agaribacterium sp. ZY112]|uniref:DUF5329 family protein n=1 Tax=Agaribacterium sp. ZY112 TaxID=3233574 RepID=UPI00352487F2